jgi:hypothetical protein
VQGCDGLALGSMLGDSGFLHAGGKKEEVLAKWRFLEVLVRAIAIANQLCL